MTSKVSAGSQQDRALGQRIAQLRQQRGLSQETLALALGVTKSQISRLESGMRRVTAEELKTISRELKMPTDALLFPDLFAEEFRTLAEAPNETVEAQWFRRFRRRYRLLLGAR